MFRSNKQVRWLLRLAAKAEDRAISYELEDMRYDQLLFFLESPFGFFPPPFYLMAKFNWWLAYRLRVKVIKLNAKKDND